MRAGLLTMWALLAVAAVQDLAAQQAVPPVPAGVSETEILDRLRQSGVTRQQARTRLAQLGYDPGLADAYFDQLEGRGSAELTVGNDFVRALTDMGILGGATTGALEPVLGGFPGDSLQLADALFQLDSLPPDSLRVFGRDVFRRLDSQFDPMVTGPVDPGYRVGPGDQLILVLTGDVEAAYSLQVAREGSVVIPDVGQVFVSGLAMEALRSLLYERLGRVYSGVRPDPSATTFFDVSLGRLRTNQVFVIGGVERPGAYQVSAAATVFNALLPRGRSLRPRQLPHHPGTARRRRGRTGGPLRIPAPRGRVARRAARPGRHRVRPACGAAGEGAGECATAGHL